MPWHHRAQKLVDTKIPFNTVTTGGQSAFHVRAVAEGSSQNGPGPPRSAPRSRHSRKGFGTGTAKGGELDGLYVVVAPGQPAHRRAGSDPDRGDGCGVLIDAAVHENVGFVGGLEGATYGFCRTRSRTPNGNAAPTRRLAYQIGCTDTTTPASIGYFTSAAQGRHSAGLHIHSAEAAGAYFEQMTIAARTAARTSASIAAARCPSASSPMPGRRSTRDAHDAAGSRQLVGVDQCETLGADHEPDAGRDLNIYGGLGAKGLNVETARICRPMRRACLRIGWQAFCSSTAPMLSATAMPTEPPKPLVYESFGKLDPGPAGIERNWHRLVQRERHVAPHRRYRSCHDGLDDQLRRLRFQAICDHQHAVARDALSKTSPAADQLRNRRRLLSERFRRAGKPGTADESLDTTRRPW